MKTQVDLILSEAAELVTVAVGEPGPSTGAAMDDLGLIPQGAVAIQDGLVLAVGPAAEIEARYESAQRISAQGGTVMPGFCDVHTHPVFDIQIRVFEGHQHIGRIYNACRTPRNGLPTYVQVKGWWRPYDLQSVQILKHGKAAHGLNGVRIQESVKIIHAVYGGPRARKQQVLSVERVVLYARQHVVTYLATNVMGRSQ